MRTAICLLLSMVMIAWVGAQTTEEEAYKAAVAESRQRVVDRYPDAANRESVLFQELLRENAFNRQANPEFFHNPRFPEALIEAVRKRRPELFGGQLAASFSGSGASAVQPTVQRIDNSHKGGVLKPLTKEAFLSGRICETSTIIDVSDGSAIPQGAEVKLVSIDRDNAVIESSGGPIVVPLSSLSYRVHYRRTFVDPEREAHAQRQSRAQATGASPEEIQRMEEAFQTQQELKRIRGELELLNLQWHYPN